MGPVGVFLWIFRHFGMICVEIPVTFLYNTILAYCTVFAPCGSAKNSEND